MRIFGLIGKSLEHSRSKAYFDHKFRENNMPDCRYENFPLQEISGLKDLIQREEFLVGLNVTIPYKTDVIPYLDRLDPVSEQIRAVNAIKIIRDGSSVITEGFNTDAPAFSETVRPLLKPYHRRALILGNGGAAKAVAWALQKLNAGFSIVSRHPGQSDFTYEELDEEIIRNHQVIINATPSGMFPGIDEFPDIPYEAVSRDHILYDLVYNPEMTVFLKKGMLSGATIKNGLEMLHLQAEMSWGVWGSSQ